VLSQLYDLRAPRTMTLFGAFSLSPARTVADFENDFRRGDFVLSTRQTLLGSADGLALHAAASRSKVTSRRML
jgi:hypothetical protein